MPWTSWPWLPVEGPPPPQSTEDIPKKLGLEHSQGRSTLSSVHDRCSSPSRHDPFELICEALRDSPGGLTSDGIFQWVRSHKPEALTEQDGTKLKRKIQQVCSGESNKKPPTLLKDRTPGGGPAYVWKMPSRDPYVTQGLHIAAQSHGSVDDDVIVTGVSRVRQGCSAGRTMTDKGTLQPRDTVATLVNEQSSVDASEKITQPMPEVGTIADVHNDACISTGTQAFMTPTSDDQTMIIHDFNAQTGPPSPAPSTTHSLPSPATDLGSMSIPQQEQFYGKLVMQIQRYQEKHKRLAKYIDSQRQKLPDLASLTDESERLSKIARELAERAQEALEASDASCRSVEDARRQAERVTKREHACQQLQHKIQRSKGRLSVCLEGNA